MKHFTITTIVSLLCVLFSSAADKHLFILSGQSNMERLKPEISFTPTVEAAYGKENVTVVKSAQGGKPIRSWYKNWKPAKGDAPKTNGELYDVLMKAVNEATEGKKYDTVTFVWMQGEKDAKQKHGEVYAASMKGLIDQLAKDLGRDDVNFVIGRLSDFDMADKQYTHWTKVRKAQVSVAEASPRGAWVDTDDLNGEPSEATQPERKNLHYTDEGYKTLGKRFAEKAIELIKKNSK